MAGTVERRYRLRPGTIKGSFEVCTVVSEVTFRGPLAIMKIPLSNNFSMTVLVDAAACQLTEVFEEIP